jgi:DNA-directed RNA polymerase specialized sigma24 family protein
MDVELLAQINKKLDAIVRMLAVRNIEGKNKTEAITTLGALGLDPNIIAEIVGTTPGTVHARLSEARRSKKAKKKVESNE